MIRRRAALFDALLALGAFAAPGMPSRASALVDAHAMKGAPLRMAMTEFPPYTGTDLPGGGIATLITRTALARQGLEMSASVRPWARALSETQEGVFDGLIGVWRNAERERTLLFPRPLGITNRIGFMARAGTSITVNDLKQLRRLTIGVVNGYANPPAIEEAQLRLEPAVDDLRNLRKLLLGRIDLALIDKGVAHYLLQTQLPTGLTELTWLEPSVTETPLYAALSRRSPEAQARAAEFNLGLDKIHKDGELDQLLKTFSG